MHLLTKMLNKTISDKKFRLVKKYNNDEIPTTGLMATLKKYILGISLESRLKAIMIPDVL